MVSTFLSGSTSQICVSMRTQRFSVSSSSGNRSLAGVFWWEHGDMDLALVLCRTIDSLPFPFVCLFSHAGI